MEYAILSSDSSSAGDVEKLRESYDDVILLRFPEMCNQIAVSKSSLKKWIKTKIKKGKHIHKLKIASIDGRDYVLSIRVWRESILPNSKKLLCLYNETIGTENTENATLHCRDQLKVLLNNTDLLRRIKYWVADLLEMKTNGRNKRLRERVEMPGDGLAYFSPFYFESSEGRIVQSQLMPNGKTFGEVWTDVLRKVQAARSIPCTSHHLAPVVIEAFEFEANFHLDPQFKMERSCWIGSRHTELKSKNY